MTIDRRGFIGAAVAMKIFAPSGDVQGAIGRIAVRTGWRGAPARLPSEGGTVPSGHFKYIVSEDMADEGVSRIVKFDVPESRSIGGTGLAGG